MDALEKIFPHLRNWEKTRKGKFTLKNIKEEARFFDYPQFKFKTIHIAGSKGKGTIAHLISFMLKNYGFKVGTFTSPHIFKVQERIQYNCKNITEDEFAHYCNIIKKTISKYKKETELTYFEILTLLSFLYFRDKKVDYGVYEAGIGGALDATCVLEPEFQIITSIEYEHTDILGFTLEKIFLQKLGIGKGKRPLLILDVSSNLHPLLGIYKEKKQNNIFLYKRDFFASRQRDVIDYFGLYGRYKLNLKDNINEKIKVLVAGAAFTTEYIVGQRLQPNVIDEALREIPNLYRLKVVSKRPLIIVDVAHTRQSVKNLVDSIQKKYNNKRFYILFSAMRNKDVVGMLFFLKKIARRFIFCSNGSKNSYTGEELYNVNHTYIGAECEYFSDIKGAADNVRGNNLFPLIVCGSFYNISQVFENFNV